MKVSRGCSASSIPLEAAVEQTFVNKDGASTLKLGQARGVAMLAPAMFGISGR
jgi:crossover junction endodeoxyribonuclease RuvC